LVFRLLEGKLVNLRVMEKEDLPLFTEWFNNTEFFGEYGSPWQWSRTEIEKFLESALFETKGLIIEKKDGSKIGCILHFNMLAPYMKILELGYALVPRERKKDKTLRPNPMWSKSSVKLRHD
jgi:RimJ/RimL family protein N-acetyltransferase